MSRLKRERRHSSEFAKTLRAMCAVSRQFKADLKKPHPLPTEPLKKRVDGMMLQAEASAQRFAVRSMHLIRAFYERTPYRAVELHTLHKLVGFAANASKYLTGMDFFSGRDLSTAAISEWLEVPATAEMLDHEANVKKAQSEGRAVHRETSNKFFSPLKALLAGMSGEEKRAERVSLAHLWMAEQRSAATTEGNTSDLHTMADEPTLPGLPVPAAATLPAPASQEATLMGARISPIATPAMISADNKLAN